MKPTTTTLFWNTSQEQQRSSNKNTFLKINLYIFDKMVLKISVDLSQTLAPALNVPPAANLTTNALQLEPTGIDNGVTSWGTGQAFVIHNFGTSAGANQRYLYFGITT